MPDASKRSSWLSAWFLWYLPRIWNFWLFSSWKPWAPWPCLSWFSPYFSDHTLFCLLCGLSFSFYFLNVCHTIFPTVYIHSTWDTDDYPFYIFIPDLSYWAAYQTSPLRCLRDTSTKKPKLSPLLLLTLCPTPNLFFQVHAQTWRMVTPFYPGTQARDQRIFLYLSLTLRFHFQYNTKFCWFCIKGILDSFPFPISLLSLL